MPKDSKNSADSNGSEGEKVVDRVTYEVSSQKSGADQLVNPGQERHDESSSAILPPNIEMIPYEVRTRMNFIIPAKLYS
jgi:hypothetical protein